MHHFDYRGGILHAEGVALDRLAAAVGTPFYCYSTATLTRHYEVFAGAFADVRALVCYAMKANSNQAVIEDPGRSRRRRRRGVGRRAQARAACRHSAARRSCSPASARPKPSSPPRSMPASSASMSNPSRSSRCSRKSPPPRAARTDISLRVNPDIDARTHAKIATGKSENKFGIPISRAREVYAHAAKLPGVRVSGVDMHIGSQITELQPFDDAFALLSEFVAHAARRRPCDRACRSRRRPRHPLSRRQRSAAGPAGLCRGGQARDRLARLHADLRARPADRRQCRHPGDPRALREARRERRPSSSSMPA